jgi:hypothetical protein
MIDKQTVRNLRERLQELLDSHGGNFGAYSIRIGNGSFTENNITFKLEVSAIKNGEVLSREAEDFKMFATVYGLKAEDFGKSFKSNGHTFKIVGLKPKSGKYPVLAEREDGRKFKFGTEHIKLLGKNLCLF